jgi:hypothetical protein
MDDLPITNSIFDQNSYSFTVNLLNLLVSASPLSCLSFSKRLHLFWASFSKDDFRLSPEVLKFYEDESARQIKAPALNG